MRPLPYVPAPTEVRESAVVLRGGTRVLLVQRPAAGRWANLWEFPHGELTAGETHEAAAMRLLGPLTGLTADIGPELLTVRHGVTRFRITLVCLEAEYRGGKFRSAFYRRGLWLRGRDLQPRHRRRGRPHARRRALLGVRDAR